MTEKVIRSFSSLIRHTIPKSDGFHMPGEWHKHARTLMLWPDRHENWKEQSKPARKAFANVIKAIAEFEYVTVGVSSNGWNSAFDLIGNYPNVTMKNTEFDDVWIRDTGPTFLINEKEQLIGGIAWDFNCWGELGGSFFGISYNVPYEKDKLVSRAVLESTLASPQISPQDTTPKGDYKVPLATPQIKTPQGTPQDTTPQIKNPQSAPYIYCTAGFILEGGSIHVDGEGTVLTTEECLLNKNRNPHLTKENIEKYLHDYLNVEKVIWLQKGLTGDVDTNGHIDNIACFISPGNVLLSWCDDPNDDQYSISRRAYEILSTTKDAQGRNLKIEKIPVPPPMFYTEQDCSSLALIRGILPTRIAGERLAASYINFYLPNGGVVAPSFNIPSDIIAFDILQRCFPDRKTGSSVC